MKTTFLFHNMVIWLLLHSFCIHGTKVYICQENRRASFQPSLHGKHHVPFCSINAAHWAIHGAKASVDLIFSAFLV